MSSKSASNVNDDMLIDEDGGTFKAHCGQYVKTGRSKWDSLAKLVDQDDLEDFLSLLQMIGLDMGGGPIRYIEEFYGSYSCDSVNID